MVGLLKKMATNPSDGSPKRKVGVTTISLQNSWKFLSSLFKGGKMWKYAYVFSPFCAPCHPLCIVNWATTTLLARNKPHHPTPCLQSNHLFRKQNGQNNPQKYFETPPQHVQETQKSHPQPIAFPLPPPKNKINPPPPPLQARTWAAPSWAARAQRATAPAEARDSSRPPPATASFGGRPPWRRRAPESLAQNPGGVKGSSSHHASSIKADLCSDLWPGDCPSLHLPGC